MSAVRTIFKLNWQRQKINESLAAEEYHCKSSQRRSSLRMRKLSAAFVAARPRSSEGVVISTDPTRPLLETGDVINIPENIMRRPVF